MVELQKLLWHIAIAPGFESREDRCLSKKIEPDGMRKRRDRLPHVEAHLGAGEWWQESVNFVNELFEFIDGDEIGLLSRERLPFQHSLCVAVADGEQAVWVEVRAERIFARGTLEVLNES